MDRKTDLRGAFIRGLRAKGWRWTVIRWAGASALVLAGAMHGYEGAWMTTMGFAGVVGMVGFAAGVEEYLKGSTTLTVEGLLVMLAGAALLGVVVSLAGVATTLAEGPRQGMGYLFGSVWLVVALEVSVVALIFRKGVHEPRRRRVLGAMFLGALLCFFVLRMFKASWGTGEDPLVFLIGIPYIGGFAFVVDILRNKATERPGFVLTLVDMWNGYEADRAKSKQEKHVRRRNEEDSPGGS